MARIAVISNNKVVAEPGDVYSTCERIFEYFNYCLEFLVGDPAFENPPKRCCSHVEKLNILAHHRTGPRKICWCIQLMVKGIAPPLIPYKIDDLPVLCGTHLSFPISDSMDCSTVG
ncbi:non-specific lipid-transfer protein 13-like [Prosopis cineraria]|uniref:non-specific lipid-transfer protein 13-like n=1 Tax=Prosopis cineraria TaxID=364024 RepID=UPI00240EFC3A|nr:non-specific lipid-transfer protein 13-like [Prosopis cineraria]